MFALRGTLEYYAGMDVQKGTPDWEKLRALIFERDGMKCVDCGTFLAGKAYNCHHAKPVSQGGRGDPMNLVSLCPSCHRKRHSYFELEGLGYGDHPIPIGKYANFAADTASRNGDGPVIASEVMRIYKVSQRTAYNWIGKYLKEKSQ
jgi:hypothetical protein